MPAILQVLTGKKAGTKYELITDEVRIGRHPDCEVPLDGNSVSRFHAHMTRDGQSYFIEDQKSRNGTLVNGKRIEARVKLNDNDRVKICETLFVYRSDASVVDGVSGSTIDTPSIEDDRPSTVLSTFDAQSAGMFVSGVRPELKLKAIFEISQAIAQTLDMDQIFDKILECSFRVF
ncbi:FHA domain-containing protein, partial [bacterium]|nr:FHA domain-containing protein [bacterium]